MRLSYAIVEVFFWKLSSKKTRLTFIQFITTSKKNNNGDKSYHRKSRWETNNQQIIYYQYITTVQCMPPPADPRMGNTGLQQNHTTTMRGLLAPLSV